MNRNQILDLVKSEDPDAVSIGKRYADTYYHAMIDILQIFNKSSDPLIEIIDYNKFIEGVEKLHIPINGCVISEVKPKEENCVVCGYELKIRSRTYDTCNSCYFDKLEGESTLSKKKDEASNG